MQQQAQSFAIHFDEEPRSNAVRDTIAQSEPHSLRTFTPSQAVLSRSAGIYHWTPEGRRLIDFTLVFWSRISVIIRNAGFIASLDTSAGTPRPLRHRRDGFVQAVSMTAYNAITELEAEATRRLVQNLRQAPGGNRMETVNWAASGSEAVQKAIWPA